MRTPHVYDKAEYHSESVEEYGLDEEHSANHTVVFLRWLIERPMLSTYLEEEAESILREYRAGEVTIHEVYNWWDGCLIDDMLSEEGNAFAMHYFDFKRGRYLQDYTATLQGSLPTEYHVEYTDEGYQRMRQIIDRRYQEWKTPQVS